MKDIKKNTIKDFGEQWSRYEDNEGWYGSSELFKDILMPLIKPQMLKNKTVVEIGSGTGRIVNMLLEAGVAHVYAIEPSIKACNVLSHNVNQMKKSNAVTIINKEGDLWNINKQVDYVFAIGVIHHIIDPYPVIEKAFKSLKIGGQIFLWLYGYEKNELYVKVIKPLRQITSRLPHIILRIIVEFMYMFLLIYYYLSKAIPLPLSSYIRIVLWPMTPQKRRLVIYDQLNPRYAKYYKKHEAIALLEKSKFKNIKIHHRHGYSWSIIGEK